MRAVRCALRFDPFEICGWVCVSRGCQAIKADSSQFFVWDVVARVRELDQLHQGEEFSCSARPFSHSVSESQKPLFACVLL